MTSSTLTENSIHNEIYGRRTRVHFSLQAKIDTIISRSEITPAEKRDSWYEKEDLTKFKNEALFIAKAIRRSKCLTKKKFYMDEDAIRSLDAQKIVEGPVRGIEHWCSKTIHSERRRDRYLLVHAVLLEQKMQHSMNAYDPNELAEISRRQTERTKELALQFGKLDFEVAHSCISPRENKTKSINYNPVGLSFAFNDAKILKGEFRLHLRRMINEVLPNQNRWVCSTT